MILYDVCDEVLEYARTHKRFTIVEITRDFRPKFIVEVHIKKAISHMIMPTEAFLIGPDNFWGYSLSVKGEAFILTNGYAGNYRDDSFLAIQVPKYVFRGFEKSCHFEYKFDSRTEQTLSFIFEHDKYVLKWLRPAPNQFRIYRLHNSKKYEPDFVAETTECIYLIETKAANAVDMTEIQAKAQAALKYCKYASEYTAEYGGKQWKYALIPHDQGSRNSSFQGGVSQNIFNQINEKII